MEKVEKEPESDEKGVVKKKKFVVRSASDLQRIRLEKLMNNPNKPVMIPEVPREKDHLGSVPSFVRNVMGSSAGAGSGEFHVYRHLRRKEYARQKHISEASKREQLNVEYQDKVEDNKRQAEEKTAKKRAKRLKKKARAKDRVKMPRKEAENEPESEDSPSEEEQANASPKEAPEEEVEKVSEEKIVEEDAKESKEDLRKDESEEKSQ
ncbi:PRKR-interacting protein 1 homolog [Phlebotomus argentipes]|uniref:PRKR-interacting protein 1 homolog n=1 Tax=Phlebotomus argentipes TaxID=94469 RepID=UPI0028932A11|nr:PRKR-interacting protein 1 homolog [Phlebotomus argentipes]